ncbi:MAG: tetratricopeptide repeat protein [Bacteroidales bacterium]|nr:tetratricopeptide repeat protein [Bacteroidales bacterium]
MKKLLFTLLAVLSASLIHAQTDIKVEVHRVVEVGEQFNVTFIIEGENKVTDFSWEPSSDFQLLWGPQKGQSSSVQIVNGNMTKSVQSTYTYILRASSAGKFTIPAASAKVKKNEITSRPVTVEVVAQQASSSAGAASQQQSQSQPQQSRQTVNTGDVFLVMSLDRTNVVVGEPVIATLKLYQRVNIAGFEGASFPSFNGFWSQELEAPTNIEFAREAYEGQIYNAALLRKFVLIPQQAGSVTVEPAELVCLVNIRVSAGGSSIFDGFFDDYRTIRQKVSSKPVRVNVSALPSGAPASFAGGVGDFTVSARLSKDVVKTHEAASLIVTVSGRGNVSLLGAPKVNFPPDMEVYDTKISDRIDKGGLSGSKVYEFPFIPRSYGEFTIDPIDYTYYDVNKKKYVTLQTGPLEITVEKGNETESGPMIVSGALKKDVRNLGSDIRFINMKDPGLVGKGTFFVATPLFLVLSCLLVVLALACYFIFRKIASRRADIAGTKNRKATKMAMKRLHLAGTFLKQNLYTAFYEELHKALLGFVSDKLNMPVAELSRDRISESLAQRGVPEDLIGTFTDILDACEFARYAPDSGNEAMTAHYNSAVDTISSIDSTMKSAKSSSKSAYAVVLFLLLVPAAAHAQNDAYVDSLWNAANNAYVEGRWDEAAKGYEMISGMGLESAVLYCNLGDAYFKAGSMADAILNYERALKMDPSYEDARYNLDLAGGMIQDRIDPVPEFILEVWAKKLCRIMDSDAWAVTFIVLLALTLAMILLFILAPSAAGRRTGFFVAVVTLILAVTSLVFSIWQKNDYMKADSAIVMRPVSSVKSSPSSESAQDLFVLHEGTKVETLDQVGTWTNIELADGRQGWIRTSDIEHI